MTTFDDISRATIFLLKRKCFCRQISSNIVKYRQISFNSNIKVFHNDNQSASRLTFSIESQTLHKNISLLKQKLKEKTSLISLNFWKFITRWKRATGRGCSFLSLILNRRIELNIKRTPKWLLSFLVPNRWMLLFLVSEIIAIPNIFFLPISSFSF